LVNEIIRISLLRHRLSTILELTISFYKQAHVADTHTHAHAQAHIHTQHTHKSTNNPYPESDISNPRHDIHYSSVCSFTFQEYQPLKQLQDVTLRPNISLPWDTKLWTWRYDILALNSRRIQAYILSIYPSLNLPIRKQSTWNHFDERRCLASFQV